MELTMKTESVKTVKVDSPAYFVGCGGVSRFVERDGRVLETRIVIIGDFFTMCYNATKTEIDLDLSPCEQSVFEQAFDHVINQMESLADEIAIQG